MLSRPSLVGAAVTERERPACVGMGVSSLPWAGNAKVNTFRSTALFVRELPPVLAISAFWSGGDGSTPGSAGLSCERIRSDFLKTQSGKYYVRRDLGAEPVEVSRGHSPCWARVYQYSR
jgi:hypothetical protein